MSGRPVRRPQQTVATMDHNVPTIDQLAPIKDPVSAAQVEALRRNCADFGIACYGVGHRWQGIVHVIGPEFGLTLPGTTIVCGDSHTATHGAFGALAFGIGTTDVEHVLATQTLRVARPRTMEVRIDGELPPGVTAKDVALGVVRTIGTAGAAGHVVEYTGSTVAAMSMEQRMTLCNLTIEAGGRAGMVAPDDDDDRVFEGSPVRAGGSRVGRGRRRVARAAQRRRGDVRPQRADRRHRAGAVRHLGHDAGAVGGGDRRGAGPGELRRRVAARVGDARARVHGSRRGHAHGGRGDRHRLHRLVHQLAHRGPPRRRRRPRGPSRRRRRARAGRARVAAGEGRRRERGPRPCVHRSRRGVARRGVLDVPRHEPRHPPAR